MPLERPGHKMVKWHHGVRYDDHEPFQKLILVTEHNATMTKHLQHSEWKDSGCTRWRIRSFFKLNPFWAFFMLAFCPSTSRYTLATTAFSLFCWVSKENWYETDNIWSFTDIAIGNVTSLDWRHKLQRTQAMNPCWFLWTQSVLRHLVSHVSLVSTPQWGCLNCKEYME